MSGKKGKNYIFSYLYCYGTILLSWKHSGEREGASCVLPSTQEEYTPAHKVCHLKENVPCSARDKNLTRTSYNAGRFLLINVCPITTILKHPSSLGFLFFLFPLPCLAFLHVHCCLLVSEFTAWFAFSMVCTAAWFALSVQLIGVLFGRP